MTAADYEFAVPDMSVRQPQPRVRFFLEPIELPGETAKEGRPIYKDQEMVAITNPGSKDEFVKKVDEKAKKQFAAQYEFWKNTQKELIQGTPLSQVPFLRPSQIMELQCLNIMSVEQLAEVPDQAIHRMGMGARDLRAKAIAYLDHAKDTAAVTRMAAELQQRDNEISVLKEQIKDIGARFEQIMRDKNAPNIT